MFDPRRKLRQPPGGSSTRLKLDLSAGAALAAVEFEPVVDDVVAERPGDFVLQPLDSIGLDRKLIRFRAKESSRDENNIAHVEGFEVRKTFLAHGIESNIGLGFSRPVLERHESRQHSK